MMQFNELQNEHCVKTKTGCSFMSVLKMASCSIVVFCTTTVRNKGKLGKSKNRIQDFF